jgi:hypothetical protein
MPLVEPPELDEGESVIVEFRANRSQGWRAVGGKVWVTTSHVRFRPHALDGATGGRSFDCEHGQIEAVDVAPVSLLAGPPGWLRRRMRIRLVEGRDELYLASRVDATVPEVSRIVSRV